MDAPKTEKDVKFVNIRDPLIQEVLKDHITLDLKLYPKTTFVYWKKLNNGMGITCKIFPDKVYGTQHIYKFTWVYDNYEFKAINNEGGLSKNITNPQATVLLDFIKSIDDKKNNN